MADEHPKARAYEKSWPGTGISEAQKIERQERAEFKDEARSLRRTVRNRGVVIPDCPYTRKLEAAKEAA